MHILRSNKFRHGVAFLVGAAIGLLYFASVVTANAETSISQVSVASNGSVQIKGATITKISGNEITAVTQWGAAKMTWRIYVSGSTRFIPQAESKVAIKALKTGHVIGFSGTMDPNAALPTVYAGSLRNETVLQASVVLGGSVIAVRDNEVLIQTQNGTSTILASSGTITTMDGNAASLSDIATGTEIKAFGTFNKQKLELKADRITAASPKIPNTGGTAPKQSIFASIASWLRLRGTYSLR
jgi:hypothetical protein